MEECFRRCGGMGAAAVMEAGVGNGGLRMKAREVTSFIGANKRRKVCSRLGDRKVNWWSEMENSVSPAATSRYSTSVVKSILDLKKGEAFETDDTAHSNGRFSTEMASSSSANKISTEATSPRTPASTAEMSSPSAVEIEEFFSAAEKYQQLMFKEKYNYDVAKDVPLEGRYKWVPLKPAACSQACQEQEKIHALNN